VPQLKGVQLTPEKQERDMERDMELQETMCTLREHCQTGERVSVGAFVDAMGRGGIGFLLFLPALVIVLPISLIPGLSFLCALLVLLSAFHIFCGKTTLWLPQRVRRIPLGRRKATAVIDRMGTVVEKMDACARPRLGFLTQGLPQKLAIGAAVILSLTTLIFGFIPLVDIVLMSPVIFFGLGFCTGDGLMMAAGWALLAASLAIANYLM
jgi:hypothetical protein